MTGETIMTTNTQSLTIGDKYVYTGTDTSVSTQYPLIFIGFNQEQAQFIPDDQVLYDLLGEPFSKKAFNDYANKHDIDDLSKKTNVTCNGEIDAWLSQDAVKTKISALEAELKSAREIMDKYDKNWNLNDLLKDINEDNIHPENNSGDSVGEEDW